jgi:hypothetical protein
MRTLIIITIIAISSFLNSCTRPENTPKKTFRYVGYIYNIEDSLPFQNTQFKVFDNGLVNKTGDEKTFLFTTDNNGYFDITTNYIGRVCWPAYFYGSAYNGPSTFQPIDDSNNLELNQVVGIYKSYTKPYH